MKRNIFTFPILFLTLCLFPVRGLSQTFAPGRTTLGAQLSALPNVTEVFRLESTEFEEKYRIRIRQMVHPNDIVYGFFEQRVFVMHKGYDRPTVLVTEGYAANYAANPRYADELSRLFNANVVVVEHRYFGESVPSPRRWEHLNGPNAMNDLHLIKTALGTLYKGKWIATGISKGGQTAMMYRTLYPNDVDITVCYVAPLCVSAKDDRHARFITTKAGTPESRKKVLDFQKEVLQRRDSLMPLFTAFCDSADLSFTRPVEDIFDYCVLEYSFAFWQWGTNPETIPTANADDKEIFAHFIQIATPDYFVRETPIMPFFIQAAKELGYYTYPMDSFKYKVERTRYVQPKEKKKWFKKKKEEDKDTVVVTGEWVTKKYPAMELKNSKNYLKELFLPDFYKPRFKKSLSNMQSQFIKQTDAKMVFIYGEWDPWTAAAVPNPNKPNILYYVEPGGSHRARVATLPEPMRQDFIEQMTLWLNE